MKISVIIPVRNPDMRLLKRALESVYAQASADFEILLVNDGSSENFAEKIRGVVAGKEKIRLLETGPMGVSAARNLALNEAGGDIVTYLDGDDTLSPLCFKEAITILENTDLDALWGGCVYGPEGDLGERRRAEREEALDELLKKTDEPGGGDRHLARAECVGEPRRYANGVYINRGIAGRFIKKEKLMASGIKFPEGFRIYEDAIWNLEMLERLKVSYVDRQWYYYLENKNSVLNSWAPGMAADMEKALAAIREILDMEDAQEYKAYTRLLMDSLRYAARSHKGRAGHLYKDLPWSEIGTEKYRKHAGRKDRLKAALYRRHLLLFIWKLKWKLTKNY